MRRFTMFRRGDLSATHNAEQANAPDVPQFEGVVFSDGTVAIRWLTALRSTSVWADLATALGVHGHPEERYRSEIVWHDSPPAPQSAPVPPATEGDAARPVAPSEDTNERQALHDAIASVVGYYNSKILWNATDRILAALRGEGDANA